MGKGIRFGWMGLGVLLLAPVCALAQTDKVPADVSPPFLVRSWQTEQGLPYNMILAVTQTQDGYLWLGTRHGLARFDGVNCRPFGLQDGLNGLEISALMEDRQGLLWIGTAGNGLSRYDHGVIRNFTVADGLNGGSVTALLEDDDGAIWVSTTSGLFCWRNGRFQTMATNLGDTDLYVRALAKDRQGVIWISTLHHGLLCYQDGKFTPVPGPLGIELIGASSLLADKQGRLWVGLSTGSELGVVLCRENGQWTRYGPKDGVPAVYVNNLVQTPDGTVWGGTLDEGLFYFKDGIFQALRMADGLSDDAVCSLFVDRQQNLWVGTRSGGLDRLNPRKLTVWHVRDNEVERLPLCLAQTTNGDFWVGASGRGIYHWNGARYEQFLLTPPLSGHLFVGAMLGTRDGSLWWGSGPSIFQWKDGQVLSSFDHEPWLRGDRVLSLCEDREGGVWIGTYNGQLQWLRDGRFMKVEGLPETRITALAQAADGTLWIGSMGGGLLRWQGGKLTAFTTKDGLPSNLISTLHLDREGTLWIGMISGGLAKWSEGRLTGFTQREGLPDNNVLQILEDDEGNLWLGCDRGICRVDKRSLAEVAAGRAETVHPLLFGNPEGMPSEQCEDNFASGLKLQDGRLCFCTARGIVVIDPKQQNSVEPMPNVRLERLLVDGRAAAVAFPAWNERKAPPPAVIGAGEHNLEFDYTGFNFIAPEKIRFRYQLEGLKLEGQDQGWQEAGAGRVAHYPYVPPGRYHFRVTASNGDGHWNPVEAELFFVVQPQFWQTGWFALAVILATLGLTGGGIRYAERRRYRARLKRLEQERLMDEERARIARDLHDELGSSLARISMLSDLGQSRENSAEQLTQRVGKISQFAVRTARSLDEIVWAVNPRNDSLRSLLEYLTQFARELFEDGNVHCRFHIPDDLPRAVLPPETRHHIFLTVKEALTNALKHPGATEVALRARMLRDRIEITVEDNGAGFDPAEVQAGSARSGLKNMRQRVESLGGTFELHSAPGQGTRVVLLVPWVAEG